MSRIAVEDGRSETLAGVCRLLSAEVVRSTVSLFLRVAFCGRSTFLVPYSMCSCSSAVQHIFYGKERFRTSFGTCQPDITIDNPAVKMAQTIRHQCSPYLHFRKPSSKRRILP